MLLRIVVMLHCIVLCIMLYRVALCCIALSLTVTAPFTSPCCAPSWCPVGPLISLRHCLVRSRRVSSTKRSLAVPSVSNRSRGRQIHGLDSPVTPRVSAASWRLTKTSRFRRRTDRLVTIGNAVNTNVRFIDRPSFFFSAGGRGGFQVLNCL